MKNLIKLASSFALAFSLTFSALAHNPPTDIFLSQERVTLTSTINATLTDIVLDPVDLNHPYVEVYISLKINIAGDVDKGVAFSIVDKLSTVGGQFKPLIIHSIDSESGGIISGVVSAKVPTLNGLPQLAFSVAASNATITDNIKVTYRVYATELID